MRVTRRVRHILSIPFFTKRPSLGDTKYKDTSTTTTTTTATTATETETAKATTNPTATTTATTTTTTTLNNDTDDAIHLDARDLTDAKSSSTFDDDEISDDSELEAGSGSGSGSGFEHDHDHDHGSGKPRVRIITWHQDDSPGGCRWTLEQERELHIALQHLDRCQKAWSSEQEVWLAYIETLNEEKEAHLDFLRLRSKQQDDERVYFRKVWSRRRPSDPLDNAQTRDASGNEGDTSDDATNKSGIRRTQSRLMRLRRFSTSSFVSTSC